MHAALSRIPLRAFSGGRLVDDALLDDGAVHGEPVGSGLGGLGGLGGGDERFEDVVLSAVSWSALGCGRGLLGGRLTMIWEFQSPT